MPDGKFGYPIHKYHVLATAGAVYAEFNESIIPGSNHMGMAKAFNDHTISNNLTFEKAITGSPLPKCQYQSSGMCDFLAGTCKFFLCLCPFIPNLM